MKKLTALFAVFGVFALGVVVGHLGGKLAGVYLGGHLDRPLHPVDRGGMPPHLDARFWAERLDRELDLSAEQRDELQEIVEDYRRETLRLRSDLRPRVRRLTHEAGRRIEAMLTPEQNEKLKAWRQHGDRRRSFFFGGRDVPGPVDGPPSKRGQGQTESRGDPEDLGEQDKSGKSGKSDQSDEPRRPGQARDAQGPRGGRDLRDSNSSDQAGPGPEAHLRERRRRAGDAHRRRSQDGPHGPHGAHGPRGQGEAGQQPAPESMEVPKAETSQAGHGTAPSENLSIVTEPGEAGHYFR